LNFQFKFNCQIRLCILNIRWPVDVFHRICWEIRPMKNLNSLVNYFLAEREMLAISLEKESSSRASLCKVCGSILMIL
jgi:hypothetical protein